MSYGSESFSWALRSDLWYNMYNRYYGTNGVRIDIQTLMGYGCQSLLSIGNTCHQRVYHRGNININTSMEFTN